MKIEIGTKEIIDFLNQGDASALKEKLSGAILACANSPEMAEAVTARVNAQIEKAINDAVSITPPTYWGGGKISGWASEFVKEWLKTQLGNLSLESIIRDETRKALDANLEKTVETVVKEINRQEVIKAVADAMVERNVKLEVHEQVQAAIKKMFGSVQL